MARNRVLNMKYARFSSEGFPLAFYADGVGAQPTDDCVEISDEQWQFFLSHQGGCRWNGSDVELYTIPAPTPTAEDNKTSARQRLQATDWVNGADVYDTARNPHLMNRDAFLDYRSTVRAIAVNPVAGNLDWPAEPTAIWSQA